MALERPSPMPLGQPVREYTTPVVGEGFYTERIDYTIQYTPIQRGTRYDDIVGADPTVIALFPNLYFLKETRRPQEYPFGYRLWATDRTAEDTYNSAIEYVSEAVNFPAFTRIYMVRRDTYEDAPTAAIGSTLTSLIGVNILDSGQDYTFATATINPQNGASIDLIVNNEGVISEGIVTNVGSGFTSPPTITVVGDGIGAQIQGIIQPQTALLVSQKKTELSDDNPLRNEYVLVTRVYESLPGPFVYSYKPDKDGIIITVAKRRNVAANVTASRVFTGGVWIETVKNGVDNFVAEEVVESRTLL
jgi:hypothetical protein